LGFLFRFGMYQEHLRFLRKITLNSVTLIANSVKKKVRRAQGVLRSENPIGEDCVTGRALGKDRNLRPQRLNR